MEKMDIPTPIKAIRLKCLDCCAGSSHEVKLCPIQDCPLYSYRFGKLPLEKKRKLTDEQKARMVARFKAHSDKKIDGTHGEENFK